MELCIVDSPRFTKIGRNDLRNFKVLQKLSIVQTGLEQINGNALRQLENLEVYIEIK